MKSLKLSTDAMIYFPNILDKFKKKKSSGGVFVTWFLVWYFGSSILYYYYLACIPIIWALVNNNKRSLNNFIYINRSSKSLYKSSLSI